MKLLYGTAASLKSVHRFLLKATATKENVLKDIIF